MDILKFTTAGSVDDGKSTLIGRLLHDTNNIKTDVLQSVTANSKSDINLAHITDGLRNERELGITIDVAYKYFTTQYRKYIITDAPGHFQYTKNLVTGASGVDAMIILIDAGNGITEQTRRHAMIAAFLRIKQIVAAINKMDAINYSEQVFTEIKSSFIAMGTKLGLNDITAIPISALYGDNILLLSKNMGWYSGTTLLAYLENCTPFIPNKDVARFSVQYVINSGKDNEQGYAGKVLSGCFNINDVVSINPNSNKDIAIIKKIVSGYDEVNTARAGEQVSIFFSNPTNAVRGSIVSHFSRQPQYDDQFDATICWLDADKPLQKGKEYILRIGTAETMCTILNVFNKNGIDSFQECYNEDIAQVNEFVNVRIKTVREIVYDIHDDIPETGRGVLIDKETNYTSGAFIITKKSKQYIRLTQLL